MKITFILPAYPYYPIGGFRIVYLYANFLVKRGHDVTVVHAFKRGPVNDPVPAWPRGARIVWRKSLYKLKSVTAPKIDWQTIDPRVRFIYVPGDPVEKYIPDADAVFATAWWTATYVNDYSVTKGKKYYLIQHWEEIFGVPKSEITDTWMMPLEKIVIARWLQQQGESIGARNMHYIPNGIDLHQFHVMQPIANRKPAILTLYHTATWKGTNDALLALAQLHNHFPHIPITMFGVQKPAEDVIPKWISFVINPSPQALVRLYNTHTIYLGASHSEGWGLPPAEAMACGCTVVCTDTGGFREYVIPGITGLISPVKKPDALYHNLVRLLEDSPYCISLQRTATQHIQQFTVDAMGSRLEELLVQQLGLATRSHQGGCGSRS